MKKLNTIAYFTLLVLLAPIQVAIWVIRLGLGFVNGLINLFLVWLMPDHVKLRILLRALAAQAAARKKENPNA